MLNTMMPFYDSYSSIEIITGVHHNNNKQTIVCPYCQNIRKIFEYARSMNESHWWNAFVSLCKDEIMVLFIGLDCRMLLFSRTTLTNPADMKQMHQCAFQVDPLRIIQITAEQYHETNSFYSHSFSLLMNEVLIFYQDSFHYILFRIYAFAHFLHYNHFVP